MSYFLDWQHDKTFKGSFSLMLRPHKKSFSYTVWAPFPLLAGQSTSAFVIFEENCWWIGGKVLVAGDQGCGPKGIR